MDILNLLDKLDDLVYNARPIPLTDQVRIDREDVYELLDQLRVGLPVEIKQAQWLLEQREDEPVDDPEGDRLKAIADSIEELKRSKHASPPPLTAAASEKVRSVIEGAEASAAEMRAEAEREARRIEQAAERRGAEIRKRSAADAATRLKRADDVTKALLKEAGAASAQIEGLLERVRGPAAMLADTLEDGATTVRADLDRIRAELTGEALPVEGPRSEGETRAESADHRRSVVDRPTEEWNVLEDDEEDSFAAELPGPEGEVVADRLEADEEDSEHDEDSDDAAPTHSNGGGRGRSAVAAGAEHVRARSRAAIEQRRSR